MRQDRAIDKVVWVEGILSAALDTMSIVEIGRASQAQQTAIASPQAVKGRGKLGLEHGVEDAGGGRGLVGEVAELQHRMAAQGDDDDLVASAVFVGNQLFAGVLIEIDRHLERQRAQLKFHADFVGQLLQGGRQQLVDGLPFSGGVAKDGQLRTIAPCDAVHGFPLLSSLFHHFVQLLE